MEDSKSYTFSFALGNRDDFAFPSLTTVAIVAGNTTLAELQFPRHAIRLNDVQLTGTGIPPF